MPESKYYDTIESLRSVNLESSLPPFDIQQLNPKGIKAKLQGWVLSKPRPLLTFARCFWPTPTVFGLTIVSRAEDVQEVLTNAQVFEAPYGREMKVVSGGGEFILGINDTKVYRTQKSLVLRAFPPEKMAESINDIAERHAAICMRTAAEEFNPIRELFAKSGLAVCREYFGLTISKDKRFYESALAVSSLLFADPFGNKTTRELAMHGAKHLLTVIDLSIERVDKSSPESPLKTLVEAHKDNPDAVPMHDVRSIMMGMILGFLPTTMLGLGNALGVILSKPEARQAVKDAIDQKDDAQLTLCIKEAMRFDPIQLGPFRYCASDYDLAKGTPRETRIKKGALVIPSTLSAMFDKERVQDPNIFMPERSEQHSMIFGYMSHSCIGAPMALAFSTQMIKTLFDLPKMQRVKGPAGCMRKLGIFPDSLVVRWKRDGSFNDKEQSLSIVALPIYERDEHSTQQQDTLQASLESMGNVAQNGLSERLDSSKIIHFASGCISPAVTLSKGREPAHLVFEITGDGDEKDIINAFVRSLSVEFSQQIQAACDPHKMRGINELFQSKRLREVGPLNRNLGLNFNGTPGHSVQRIKQERDLFDRISQEIEKHTFNTTSNALDALIKIRHELSQTKDYEWAFTPVRNRLSESPQGFIKFFRQYLSWPWAVMPASITIGFIFLNFMILGGWQDSLWYNLWHLGAAITMTVFGGVIFVGGIAGTVVALLRSKEKSDDAALKTAAQADYDAITANENQLQQNHMFAVSRIKAGFLRSVLLRAVLWSIQVSIGSRNPPGIVSVINTIHFAKWVRIPNTRQLLFLSNYGGSWESYLEDFITHGADGLTGIWSNTEHFPSTQYLLRGGATLSEPFKRWARMQQKPTPFWYVAYKNVTTREIRKHAAVRDGFAKIDDPREARQWFRLFGSSYRPNTGLDKSNIQSLVFGSMAKQFPHSKMLFIALNENASKAANKKLMTFLLNNVKFGERLSEHQCWQVAFTERGLRRIGLNADTKFSNVFRQGMDSKARQRILGDLEQHSPENWLWGHNEKQIDLLLINYFADYEDGAKKSRQQLDKLLKDAKAKVIHEQATFIKSDDERPAVEHFDFSDGVSQPIISGTRKSHRTEQIDHRVQAGEILCGYPDERGNVAPSPVIDAEFDGDNILPEEPFQPRSGEYKDFGFNGTYLVVRQLEQHVDSFKQFCETNAKRIQSDYDMPQADADWVAAKMIGRWKDGRPLVSYPYNHLKGEKLNDFRYREEDPQGLQCPLGAHIRRANPRDSFADNTDEDKAAQIKLSNRHRILRVGRAYDNDPLNTDDKEKGGKGLMFMCMNSDIERQFEFVQQTWLNNSNFHGLSKQEDALSSGQCPVNKTFSIPTEQGMIRLRNLNSFVTVRGGAYFFMPGKQALVYLSKL